MGLMQHRIDKARLILEEIASRRGTPICYSDLTHKVGVAPRAAGGLLKPICTQSKSEKKVMLGVLAVSKRNKIPSEPFFDLAKELGMMRDDELPQLFFRSELQRVYDAYGATAK
jgi:hypothetical protein